MAATVTTPANPESVVWTEEETRYLRAVMSLEFLRSEDPSRKRAVNRAKLPVNNNPPVGEFRVLVIGAKGVGKTSILTRFCKGRLPAQDEPHDPYYDQGCRRVIEIDSQNYTIDALEMPSKHLWRDDLVVQAINITEAAILVYDVTDQDSLRLAQGLHDLIHTTVAGKREYGLALVGNKSDVPDSERKIAYSDGSKVATTFQVKTSFMEVSAKTGDQIGLLFPQVGKDVLKLKWINQQKKEYAEKMVRMRQEAKMAPKRGGIWKRISRPWFRREVAQN